MLTFEKVLSVFDPFLAENGIYEIVQTSHGHTILEWDSRSREWISVKLCATPEELAETLLDDLMGYLAGHQIKCRTRMGRHRCSPNKPHGNS